MTRSWFTRYALSASRRETALLSYPRPIIVEQNRHRRESHAEEAEQGSRPGHTEGRVHIVSEERLEHITHQHIRSFLRQMPDSTYEGSASYAPDESVDRNCAIGVEAITVDDVVHALPEGDHGATAQHR